MWARAPMGNRTNAHAEICFRATDDTAGEQLGAHKTFVPTAMVFASFVPITAAHTTADLIADLSRESRALLRSEVLEMGGVMKAGKGKILVAAMVVLAGTLFAGQGSAGATTAWAPDHFKVCWTTTPCDVYAEGDITWGNRTANVSVRVVGPGGYATAHFDAFAGSTKVDSHISNEPGEQFNIGNPNLPGGINRIRTQVCFTAIGGETGCGGQWNDIRD
jgi:hypothetical protein